MARARRPVGPHGPSAAARARGHRLDASAADAVVHALRGASPGGAPLTFLAALLAAACTAATHALFDTLPRMAGGYTLREALSWRAERLRRRSDAPPMQSWSPEVAGACPTSFAEALRVVWRSLLRTARGRATQAATTSPSPAPPPASSTCRKPKPHCPRPAAVGALPCAFPDTPPPPL